jgi:hypothetical protein
MLKMQKKTKKIVFFACFNAIFSQGLAHGGGQHQQPPPPPPPFPFPMPPLASLGIPADHQLPFPPPMTSAGGGVGGGMYVAAGGHFFLSYSVRIMKQSINYNLYFFIYRV